MPLFPKPIEDMIDQLARLPGVGRKGAQRLAFFLLDRPEDEVRVFANAILHARESTGLCTVCQNLSEGPVCLVCGGEGRDRSTLCVVGESSDVAAIERCREYKGLYHVLHGVISPTKRKSPDDIKLAELLTRLEPGEVREVILATNPDTDGDTTALYIARLLRPYSVRVTRLAYGIPMGGHVGHSDEVTLLRALDGRRDIV